ncbi:MAG TPA: MFS transporter, partial [Anaerolineae bacterium]|nr:MFS transporter [Anaerolineae bacterium]
MMTSTTLTSVRLGLRANWEQFTLLVIVNAFVGAMVGLERTVLPLIAEADFGLVAKSVTLSFLVSFGVVKALANLFAGRFSDRVGRKRILIAGWLAGLPVPFLIIFAPSWGWVVFANVLLGINQGLCWSTTVIMKIDLVGPKQRGLAMGLNEFAGYLAVSISALATGYMAAAYGLRPVPFYPGIAFAVLGLLLSIFFVRETHGHARYEAQQVSRGAGEQTKWPQEARSKGAEMSFAQILLLTSWKDRALFAASQAGLVNNLNDGMVWGLVPIFLAGAGLPLEQIGLIAATYPGVWGLS